MEIAYEIQEGEVRSTDLRLNLLCMTFDRAWQCGTVQLDFALPERLGATYGGEDNERHTPVMIHRAILGSLERFIGILIEEYAGFFPTWLAPEQAIVMGITDKQSEYVQEIAKTAKKWI